MKLTLDIHLSRIISPVMAALWGCAMRWADYQGARMPSWQDPDLRRFEVTIMDIATGQWIVLREEWSTGLRLMAERYRQEFAEFIAGNADSTTGDMLIQLAAFGELRYGESAAYDDLSVDEPDKADLSSESAEEDDNATERCCAALALDGSEKGRCCKEQGHDGVHVWEADEPREEVFVVKYRTGSAIERLGRGA